ncbi:pyrroloquinoline quinone biosynthesis peptide chaperone PqqD [Pseudohongiella nitratireducens]|uniref:pyrroloquinoline quinone biosynthesis peptide chaperone PqqD n=1 Tax=Pseudohongiella nitratireducens TaxID=1768907 RepID=UPI0030EBBF27|tara:strand:+ start:1941 stop:2279 length:339 start_codon:yes stop_codon:yes gene_type:complete
MTASNDSTIGNTIPAAPLVMNGKYRLQWEEAQDCHVLLYPEGLVKLSDSAYEVLSRCQHPVTAADLIAQLQQDYPDAETLARDVQEFLVHALQHHWLITADQNSAKSESQSQ